MRHFLKPVATLLAVMLLVGGCAPAQSSSSSQGSSAGQSAVANLPGAIPENSLIVSEDENTVTFVDCLGKTQVIPKRPQRVVVAYNSLLDLWYLLGGTAVARVTTTENVPKEAQSLPEVGGFNSLNPELVLASQPDLVLLNGKTRAQRELIPLLEENNIPYIASDTKTDSFGSFWQYAQLYAAVQGNEDVYSEKILPLYSQCMDIVQKGQSVGTHPTYAVLYATTKSVKLDSDYSQTGQMLSMLGGVNVVEKNDLVSPDSPQIDFSMETLVARDPEYLLISTMGDVDTCKEYIEQNIIRNSAWSSLSAVKNNRVIYLDKELSLFKPNARYPEAFAYMAKILYPDKEW